MRKVYLPVYLIEWSDIRPYVIKAGHALKVGAHYTAIGLKHLAVWTGIGLQYLWKALKWLLKWLLILIVKFFKGLWNIITGIFTVANPKSDEEEDEEDNPSSHAANDDGNDAPEYEVTTGTGSLFDGED